MSDPRGGIVEYRASIGVYPDREVLEPAAAFPSWTTFVSHRAVRAIAVAPVTRIAWIATWAGVLAWNRKDEFVYRRYSSEHGIGGTPSCIAVADDEAPWVGHAEGGLSYFENDRWYPYEYLRTEPVLAIAAASGGRVWVATPTAVALVERGGRPVEVARDNDDCAGATALLDDGDGVLIASPSGVFRASDRSAVARVRDAAAGGCYSLARAADGGVLVGTSQGLMLADGTIVAPAGGDPAAIAIVPTRSGVWVLTRGALARVAEGEWRAFADTPVGMATPRAIAAARANDDYLWVGTDNLLCGVRASGDDPWDVDLLPNHAEDAIGNIGRCAVADRSGRVWIGTSGGLFVGKKDGTWSFDADAGDVRAVLSVWSMGGESLAMLAWPTGLSRLTTDARGWEPAPLPPGLPRALAMPYYYGDPHALIGDRIWRLDAAGPVAIAGDVPPRTHHIAQAPGGDWFAATDRGLFRYADGSWSLESAIGTAPIASLVTMTDGMWVGVGGACWSLDASGWAERSFAHAGVAWTEPVTALAAARSAAEIWIACGGRVARCDRATGAVIELHDRFDSGICGADITALVEAAGFLWVVSRAGIARHTLAP